MTQTTTQLAGAANNAPARAPRPVDILKAVIKEDEVQQQFRNALGKNSGTFLTSVVELFTGDSKLQKCEPKRVLTECLKAATLRLPISKALGFAFVIPYKSRAKQMVQKADGSYREEWVDVYTPSFQIGYKVEKPLNFDPFGHPEFAHLWLQYDCPFKVLVLGVNIILPF